MDLVTTGVQASQSRADAAREAAARPNGQSSVGNLVAMATDELGIELDAKASDRVSDVVHYLLGVVPGAIYGVLRPRLPLVGAWRGAIYGLLLFGLNDEWANTALGLSGPPEAYPASSHIRGAIGHAELGLVTDAALDILGGGRRSA